MSKLIYIASPYSGTEEEMQQRYEAVRDFTAKIMMDGSVVPFSPIVHCHDIAQHHELPRTHEFWLHIDETYLRHCDELWVLMIPGWEDSFGVASEVKFANRLHIPVYYKCEVK